RSVSALIRRGIRALTLPPAGFRNRFSVCQVELLDIPPSLKGHGEGRGLGVRVFLWDFPVLPALSLEPRTPFSFHPRPFRLLLCAHVSTVDRDLRARVDRLGFHSDRHRADRDVGDLVSAVGADRGTVTAAAVREKHDVAPSEGLAL